MKLAFVTPRYGLEVIGGAELGARLLSEQLVARLGWEVGVFTTRAVDAGTWADVLPAGRADIGGVGVHRFSSASGRHPDFDRLSDRVLHKERPTRAEQLQWIEHQGPVCPAAVDAAAASDAELVAFYPYLFYPTVVGVPRLGRRAVLHPAAHDELPIRLPIFREVFEGVRGIWFQTEGERRLVERLFPATVTTHQTVLGLGVKTGEGDAAAARSTVGGVLAGRRPYLLCLGRVDRGKGSDLLARYFAEYKARRPGPLALVFAGPVVHAPPPHPDIVVAGAVDEATKWGLLRGAELLVSPSAWESFSLVLIEAWSVGVPALVNGRCEATRGQCEVSGGGLWFDDYPVFEAALDRLVGDASLAARIGAAGSAYVEDRYRWPRIVDGYAQFCDRMLAAPVRG